MSAALLMLDYQEGLCRPDGAIGGATGLGAEVERRGVLDAARDVLATARELGLTIVHAHVRFDAGYALRTNRTEAFAGYEAAKMLGPNDPGADICSEVAPRDGEAVLRKGRVDPFVGTPLFEILISHGVTKVFLGGVATNFVVESAVRHAADSGYDVHVVDELCASFDQGQHDFFVETILPVFGKLASAGDFRALASGGANG